MFFPPKANFSYRFENGRRYHAYKDGYDMHLSVSRWGDNAPSGPSVNRVLRRWLRLYLLPNDEAEQERSVALAKSI